MQSNEKGEDSKHMFIQDYIPKFDILLHFL